MSIVFAAKGFRCIIAILISLNHKNAVKYFFSDSTRNNKTGLILSHFPV